MLLVYKTLGWLSHFDQTVPRRFCSTSPCTSATAHLVCCTPHHVAHGQVPILLGGCGSKTPTSCAGGTWKPLAEKRNCNTLAAHLKSLDIGGLDTSGCREPVGRPHTFPNSFHRQPLQTRFNRFHNASDESATLWDKWTDYVEGPLYFQRFGGGAWRSTLKRWTPGCKDDGSLRGIPAAWQPQNTGARDNY